MSKMAQLLKQQAEIEAEIEAEKNKGREEAFCADDWGQLSINRQLILRRALMFAAGFNLLAALLFAFPVSFAGQFAGLPAEVPLVYRGMTALFVLLFGAAYAWLAGQNVVDRGLVIFGAIGKFSAFVLVALLWRLGAASGIGVLIASGDAMLAAVFLWCVGGGRSMASTRDKATRLRN